MLPEYRIFGGLAVLALAAIIVFALQLFDFGAYLLAGLAGLLALWMIGAMLYGVGNTIVGWVRERIARR